jgi:hypothetical protein
MLLRNLHRSCYLIIILSLPISMTNYSPFPLLLAWVRIIWLSSSCSSDFSSCNFVLLFFTIEATSDNARRSVATSLNFSAPSLICVDNTMYYDFFKLHEIYLKLLSYFLSDGFFKLFESIGKVCIGQIVV